MKKIWILFVCICFCLRVEGGVSFTQFEQEWRQLIGHRTDLKEISAEFALLEEFSENQLGRLRAFIQGIDRHPEWVPFRENGVHLNDGTEMSASFIQAGCDSFIATQAPMLENRHLFWQMLWEQRVDQIVMTTELLDVDGEELASSYWPDAGKKLVLENGIEVALVEENWLQPNIQIRTFSLRLRNQIRQVTHYWYHNWIDGSIPDLETLLKLVEVVGADKKSIAPILVHCAAGVGRTGVFISLYHMMHADEPIALFDLVAKLRWQRPDMVGVLEQYAFCYRAKDEITIRKAKICNSGSKLDLDN